MRVCYGPGWRKRAIGASHRRSSNAAAVPAVVAASSAAAALHDAPAGCGVIDGSSPTSKSVVIAEADAVVVSAEPEVNRQTVRFQEDPSHVPSRNSVGVGPLDGASIAPRIPE